MKILTLTLILTFVFLVGAGTSAQAPVKLFDVRNGNGIVDGGTVQPFAFYIAFKDNPAKQEVIDAFCTLGNYDALDPATRPTKQAFTIRELQFFIRDKVKENRRLTEQKKIVEPVVTDLP